MAKSNLEHIRHSFSHLLAAAVLELYPGALPTIGPAIDNGFYYDFDFKHDTNNVTISEKDLPKIEKKMREILKTWDTFEREEVSANKAREIFKNNPYKLEIIEELVSKNEPITLYHSKTKKSEAKSYFDLCRGGHAESAKEMKSDSFKLNRLAGVYWRSDENKPQLTRIYGLAFESKKSLADYEKQLEEAAKRDHRKIGKEMNLFTFSELVGPGLPLFTPKGTAMRNAIIDKIYSLQKAYGFQEVSIPHITKPELYKTSGHFEKFGDELFKVRGRDSDFVMKPMNCPHHTQIYASTGRSYKDLPIRFAEATTVYRDEQSGEMLGLSRTRGFTQDDGHIFCTPDQIEQEVKNIIEVVKEFYTSLDMWKEGGFEVSLSTRNPKTPEEYLGSDEIWDLAEKSLGKIAQEEKLPYKVEEGEAAFYGPKLDFKFRDAIGRQWQLATVQLDFNMPSRFGLEYTDKDGSKKTPVMIHRAIAGSLERFLSVIIEHFAGNFPFWLSPVQVKVLPIGGSHQEFAKEIHEKISATGFRSELDSSDENLGKKVRKAKQEKIPYLLIIGDQELQSKSATVEHREGGKLGTKSAEEILEIFKKEK